MRFESDVISDGTQTVSVPYAALATFESDVISDGTQTVTPQYQAIPKFESDGTQTL